MVKRTKSAPKRGVKTGGKTTRKTRKPSSKENGKGPRVKRVAPDKSPLNISAVAAELGYADLAKKISLEKPKPIITDVTKNNGGNVFRRYDQSGEEKETRDDFLKRFADLSEEEFAAWILGNEAAEKIVQAEDTVAKLTKEYWQAKRRLICATQVLNAAYDKLEKKGTLVTTDEISKTEARNVVARVLAEELFPPNKPL